MAKAKARSKKSPDAEPFGLRPDGGWGDAVRTEFADVRGLPFLEALLSHLVSAKPRKPFATFSDAQRQVDGRCFTLPIEEEEADDDDGPPLVDDDFTFITYAPGSEEYAAELWRAAPDEKWLEGFDALSKKLGKDRVEAALVRWISSATRSKPGILNRSGANRWLLHAAIFGAARLGTPRCVDALRQLAQSACDNKTAQGPTCAVALALVATPDALGALQMLSERAKRPAHRHRFGRPAQHLQLVTGITADDAAERYAPTFDLAADGTRSFAIGGCTAELCVGRDGAVDVQWRNADGKPVKSAPAAARNTGAAAVADLKATAKSIEKSLSSQRDRLDRLMINADEKRWSLGEWRAWYVDHPIVGLLARRLIWLVGGKPSLFKEPGAAPQDVKGRAVKTSADPEVRVWHPALRPPDEVLAWRERLAELGVTQPFKQAYREVYLLTDAERRTATYSNRFAAHVIRQHQFRQLAMQRGWDAPLKMIHDGTFDRVVSRDLRRRKLRVELWTEPGGTEEHNLTASGAFLHIITDQVRFYRAGEREPMLLEQVPALVFSEIMRDVDLFVGVASVGNDPTWQDGGPGGRFRDYWQRASFGDIGETSKTRRAALEKIVPRLVIARRCKLGERFLVVKGDLRTYKIHLGSGNILMEPNDQYLCIVPERGRARDATGEPLFLPFEGDATLSLILSKAMLLADDEAIIDPTILRQIKTK